MNTKFESFNATTQPFAFEVVDTYMPHELRLTSSGFVMPDHEMMKKKVDQKFFPDPNGERAPFSYVTIL